MRPIKLILSFFLIAVAAINVAAQLPDSIPQRDDIVGEIIIDAARTKVNSAIQLALDFESNWDSGGITGTQKEKIEAIYILYKQKSLTANPYLIDFLNTISLAGANELISLNILDDILNVTEKVIENERNGNIHRYFMNLNTFLTHRAIYYSNGYKLLVDNIDISFEYAESTDPIPEDFIDVEPLKELEDGQVSENNTDDWGNDNETNDSWVDDWDTTDDWSTNNSEDNWGGGGDQLEDSESTGMELTIDAFVDPDLPPERGPYIKFGNADLIFQTNYDTIKLVSTKGSFLLVEEQYLGNGGSFNWSSTGLNREDVYCNLNKYAFDVNIPHFNAHKSQMFYEGKIDGSIEGNFEYKSTRRRPGILSSYPQFTSYAHDIQVYFPYDKELTYIGGFAMVGNQVWGKSFLKENAILEAQDKTGILFRAIAPIYKLGDTLITTKNARFTIYQGSDSIFHPSVKLEYEPAIRNLMVFRDDGPFRMTPYSISHFNMDITADMIQWDLDEDSVNISISSARNIIPAYFESKEYFNKEDMNSLTGIYDFNPLIMTVHYARKLKKLEFYVFDLAEAMKQNEKAVKAAMIGIMQNGFIDYDQNTGLIRVNQKAFHYVDANRFRKDFDDMKIKSVSPVLPNGTIDLNENTLTIRGIEKFYISEILNVFIVPKNNSITLKGNRDMAFNGQLYAGNFEFIGREFLFDYDSFMVDLNYIDSIRFYIEDPETGMKRMVGNKLVSADTSTDDALAGLSKEFRETTGRLFINRPDNKSGQRMFPQYPRFTADKGAIVYFNNNSVLNGAYDERVYFIIPPFEIDSLSDSDPAAIGFDGTFVAEGILPPFQETLLIQADNSLGFKHVVSPEGYNLYNGPGKIYNRLTLDKNGLTAKGSLEYISSTVVSDSLTFYLDSLTGTGSSFWVDRGEFDVGSFPDVIVDDFRLKWLPRKDSMYITNLGNPFTLYDNTATLDGVFTVNKLGGYGRGVLLTKGAEVISDEFSFNESRFGARHSNFIIKSDIAEKPAFAGDDVKLDFNLTDNYADIGPEIEGIAAITFPYAQFKTSISNARWDLENKKVEMAKPPEVDIINSYFYSTLEDLDSLAFNASQAVYDIEKLELLVSGIPYINVADAKITPENNEVLILENSKIGTLYNTSIVIDTLYEFHHLYDGTIDIISRNKFEGRATYQYVNAVYDTFAIKIDEFNLVESEERGRKITLHTQAMGYVYEDDGVVISPGLSYKGEAIMYAPDPAFKLDGYVRLQYRISDLDDVWIKYQNSGQSKEVQFDFNKARTENDTELIAGIFYNDNDQLYSSFISPKESILDPAFFTPDGILSFDADSTMYRIEDSVKINGNSYSGRIFNYKVTNSDIQFEGPVNFNMLTQDLEITGAVVGTGNLENNTYNINAFMTLDFKLPSQALAMISEEMIEIVDILGMEMAYSDDPMTMYKASELIGEKAVVEFEERSLQEYTSLVSISQRLIKTIAISNVDLFWSKENKAWYSVGKIGVANMGSNDINASADGFLEIKKTEDGDVVNLFLQFSPSTWYFFNFEENRMITSSSNEDYLNYIADKTTATKADFGDYFYLDGELSDALKFVDAFRSVYLNINEPYEIEFAPSQDNFMPLEETEESDDGFIIPEEVVEEEEDDDGF